MSAISFKNKQFQALWPRALQSSLPRWVFILMLAIAAYQCALLTWQVVQMAQGAQTDVLSEAVVASVAQKSRLQAETESTDIASMHLFGIAGQTRLASAAPISVPVTSLNLTLHGVFQDAVPEKSGAIIGTSGQKQIYYHVGQKVSGVTLHEVRSDHVILLRQGKYESLRFPENTSPSGAVNITSRPTSAVGVNRLSKQKIMENVRAIPVFDGKSGLKGYRLLPQKDRAMYNRLGISPSDIVLSINGISLSNEKEAMNVIKELSQSNKLEIEIDRHGKKQTLSVNLE